MNNLMKMEKIAKEMVGLDGNNSKPFDDQLKTLLSDLLASIKALQKAADCNI